MAKAIRAFPVVFAVVNHHQMRSPTAKFEPEGSGALLSRYDHQGNVAVATGYTLARRNLPLPLARNI
jgi:hypothetical protein